MKYVCAVCHDRGIITDDDRQPEWCDCDRGEEMAEEAEWAARFGHAIQPDDGARDDQPW